RPAHRGGGSRPRHSPAHGLPELGLRAGLALPAPRRYRTKCDLKPPPWQNCWQSSAAVCALVGRRPRSETMPSAEAKSIFGKALELEPAARAAYLDEACAGDPRLRARIDGLVDAHGRAGGFLESPAPTPLPDPTADPPP